jgi:hypothetical protein
MQVKPFQEYLKGLCVLHKELQHGVNGKTSFIYLMSSDELSSLPENPAPIILIVDNITGAATGGEESSILRQLWQFSILGKIDLSVGNTTDAITNMLQKTFEIGMQIFAKMRIDLYNDSCGSLAGMQLNKVTYKVEETMLIESHYGFEFSISQITEAPEYDPLKWN